MKNTDYILELQGIQTGQLVIINSIILLLNSCINKCWKLFKEKDDLQVFSKLSCFVGNPEHQTPSRSLFS